MVYPTSSLPQTSSAVNIQIIEPKNFPGGAAPGAMLNNGVPQDMFQAQGASQGMANPYTPPQQQLQDAYNQALNARNAAEQSRNNYLNLANQLNGQALQQNQNPFGQGGFGPTPQGWPPAPVQPGPFNPNDPQQMAQWQQQQQQLQQQQQMAQWQQQQQQLQQQQQMAQWQQQQQQMEQMRQQQAQQQPMDPNQQQQPPVDPNQPQQPPVDPNQPPEQPEQKPALGQMPVEELNRMIAQPQTLQEKVDAMEEIGVRGQGTPETYQLLTQEATSDTSQLAPGQAQDDANYIRQAALWTMGMLNKAQNSQTPTASLPGLNTIEQIINNKNENPDVKQAAVQALQVINRPTEKPIAKILKKASKDSNPDVQRLAQEALSGKSIPLPGQGQPGEAPLDQAAQPDQAQQGPAQQGGQAPQLM